MDHLVCVRAGELVWDPRLQGLHPTPTEMLKVRGQADGWSCHFFDPASRSCSCYTHRPAECRALACWNTAAILEVMEMPPLTRAAIVVPGSALAQVIAEHEASYPAAQTVAQAMNPATQGLALETARRERYFRAVLAERLGVEDTALWPYLGRPLAMVVAAVMEHVSKR